MKICNALVLIYTAAFLQYSHAGKVKLVFADVSVPLYAEHSGTYIAVYSAWFSVFTPIISPSKYIRTTTASSSFSSHEVPVCDYQIDWRNVPLLDALSLGVASVESDVWLINGTLFVGHELAALTDVRTFASLYVDPLVQIVEGENPQNEFTLNQTSLNGVFDMDGTMPLQLLVDIKTDGVEALPFILEALEPLRSRGFLTTFANGTITPAPILVIGTGNSPLEQVKELSPRDYFFDAPLDQLTNATLNTTWDVTLSPIASCDYGTAVGWSGIGNITDAQRSAILTLVSDAHARGIKARFWDTPGWPINARTNVWVELMNDGSDWLNADDLEAASSF
ncbi:hypothetical protein EW145_g544 [Phellinidium pouzarii]|uniref:Altered inheritance of mitochondria protein 6 n=1 Tax=Phellinidium pouzarii TaxID=167371 RepID=A0A4S4LHW8_9AGAM|nr:hypothetical protein EW145_g544 [Phellinidium pouzarii]